MNNLCVPYKGFNLQHITQGWSESHKAFDIAKPKLGASFGTWLVAMENCIVENIMSAENWDNGWEYDRGFGILLRSIANPEVKYSYWHTLAFFPVNKGDTVLQGQPVAMLGNSGYCISNGQVVQYKDKLKYPFLGAHCHLSCPQNTIDRIDFSIPINFDLITTISLTLKSMAFFLKNKLTN
jgi:hypothetical protein